MSVAFLASNFELPRFLRPCQRVPWLRTSLRFLLIWFKLWRYVRQADVVHVFVASWLYFFVTVCPSILVGCLLGKRTVLNYRGGAAASFFRRWRWAIWPIFRTATLVTAPSGFLAKLIQAEFGVPVSVVSNILDTSVFPFRLRANFRPKLLVNRNLERIYDIASVLQAFREIRRLHPDASLCIVGSGSDEQRLRRLAHDWGLTNARFLGHVDHSDLPAIYEDCDILLNASTIDNFPAALIEASAAGLVIVSTAAGGIPYVYQNESSALLVEIGDWEALAAAVDRVVRDPSIALRLITEGKVLAQGCAWERVRTSVYAAYGLALAGSARQPVAEKV